MAKQKTKLSPQLEEELHIRLEETLDQLDDVREKRKRLSDKLRGHEKVTRGTIHLARRLIGQREERAARAAAKACTTGAVAKKAIASLDHHAKARRAEEREAEGCRLDVWMAVQERATVDHRGRCCCEACHRPRTLEPHHLELGAGGRPDRIDLVMALCRDCHTLDADSAHRRPRFFALTVVVPWARGHGYALPNRKEYRDA
jgi:hypothetical protein